MLLVMRINISKAEMEKIAVDNGFLSILEKTWFCHYPKFGNPCGICFPCQLIMRNKLYNKIPLPFRIRYHLFHAMKKI
jgi:7-cyano-7-deazaguanine synthase in queuosine biosynthesis